MQKFKKSKMFRHVTERQKPSIKASWVRKLLSGCKAYEADFELFSLLHDIHLASQLTSLVAVADRQKMAPEDAASSNNGFDTYWLKENEKLEDMCRQMGQFPNLFMTIAPGEWKFDWNRGVHQWRKESGESLSDAQATFAIHMHHVIGSILHEVILKRGDVDLNDPQFKARVAAGIGKVHQYSFRWEFQSRGTLHVHIVAWVDFSDEVFGGSLGANLEWDPTVLNGRSNRKAVNPALVDYLEKMFNASVDVQCGDGNAAHLKYVTGYVSKASDALTFKQKIYVQKDCTTWRQTYRLLRTKSKNRTNRKFKNSRSQEHPKCKHSTIPKSKKVKTNQKIENSPNRKIE